MFRTNVVEKIITHFLYTVTFSRISCRLWYNVEQCSRFRQATDDSVLQHMRFACWITKATDIHSECVMLIAFSRQTWLRENTLMLRYTCIASLVYIRFISVFKNDLNCWRSEYCVLHSTIWCCTEWSKNLCAPDDYSAKNTQKYFKQFQSPW
jgi:hypothetical protein